MTTSSYLDMTTGKLCMLYTNSGINLSMNVKRKLKAEDRCLEALML